MMVPWCLRFSGRMFLITEGHSRMSGAGPDPYFEARVLFSYKSYSFKKIRYNLFINLFNIERDVIVCLCDELGLGAVNVDPEESEKRFVRKSVIRIRNSCLTKIFIVI